MLDSTEIMDILPHRYPFLLVDRILELESLKRVVGIKNVTINEPFFVGHYPGHPVMPGVLICEAMAQVAGVMLLSAEEHRKLLPMFTGMDKVRFRASVRPGDTLRIESEMLRIRGMMGKVAGRAYVGENLVAEGELMFYLKDINE
ncbi:MAG: 3-hydroxyacyl-ACP dehydratase FabZ [Veillonellaceae bacterium]|nr:3-hydroxyacyl-ACP dehydratase FabZ [Veillonellaceae bacterium]